MTRFIFYFFLRVVFSYTVNRLKPNKIVKIEDLPAYIFFFFLKFTLSTFFTRLIFYLFLILFFFRFSRLLPLVDVSVHRERTPRMENRVSRAYYREKSCLHILMSDPGRCIAIRMRLLLLYTKNTRVVCFFFVLLFSRTIFFLRDNVTCRFPRQFAKETNRTLTFTFFFFGGGG